MWASIYKTGAGTLTLMGDAGTNFNGNFVMEAGRLNLSRNQALGSGGTSRLTVKGGQLGRTNTPTSNFSYALQFIDLHVFRYDLSDAPAQHLPIHSDRLDHVEGRQCGDQYHEQWRSDRCLRKVHLPGRNPES